MLKAARTENEQQSGRQAAPGVRDHGVSNCNTKDLVLESPGADTEWDPWKDDECDGTVVIRSFLPLGWLLEELCRRRMNHSETLRPEEKDSGYDVEVVMQEMWWEVRR